MKGPFVVRHPPPIAGILYKAVCINLYGGTSWKESVKFPAALCPLEEIRAYIPPWSLKGHQNNSWQFRGSEVSV